MTYNTEFLTADFISYIKALQKRADYETHAFKLARALNMRVKVGLLNRAYPEAMPQAVVVVQPWFYGWDNDVLRHEIAHVMLYWSGLESHIIAEFGPDVGWKVIENLCNQAVAFLQITQPMVDQSVRRYGVTAQAVRRIQKISGADVRTALRRLIFDDSAAERAGFISSSSHIIEVACCNSGLPFWLADRVPEPAAKFGSEAQASFVRLSGGLIGVCNG